jgi:acyl carrier protein
MDVGRWIVLHLATLSGEAADAVASDGLMDGFDIDSFDAVEMAFALEREFGIEIDPEFFMNRLETVAQVIARVQGVVAAGRG